jgi:hypothetical protein
MDDIPQVNSAIDAVRCLYLARVSKQRGHADAAQRWQQLAEGWLNRLERSYRPSPTTINQRKLNVPSSADNSRLIVGPHRQRSGP